MIGTLVGFGGAAPARLAVWLAWGSVAGSALQCLVQLPAVRAAAPGIRVAVRSSSEHLRAVVAGFAPVLLSRGVVQVSAYVDAVLASLLPTGAVTALANAQLLYTLPVSLFGMSIAAAELPALSGDAGVSAEAGAAVRARLERALRHVAYFVIPSAVAFVAVGDVIAAGLLQTGRFRAEDARYVWALLAGSAVGLLPSTLGRLYASTFYAFRDTRTPLRYAVVHVAVATVLGYLLAIPLPRALGVPPLWGAAGLTLAAGLGGWAELALLRRTLARRIGRVSIPFDVSAKVWLSAAGAAAIAWAIRLMLPPMHPVLAAVVILGPFGGAYLAATLAVGVPEASSVRRTLLRLQ
jgi:putative peptidoglycan lipid II flippase